MDFKQEHHLKNIPLRFDRGSDLTLFKTERKEDWVAFIFAIALAFGVFFFAPM